MRPACEPSVLVIDDEQLVRSIVTRYLVRSNFRVVQVSSAEEALSTLEHESFDVILTDANLDGLSGLSLFTRMQAVDPKLPVFIMSGEPCPTQAPDAMRKRWLEKPLNFAGLGQTLSTAIQSDGV